MNMITNATLSAAAGGGRRTPVLRAWPVAGQPEMPGEAEGPGHVAQSRAAGKDPVGWAFQIINAFFPTIKQNLPFTFRIPAGWSFDGTWSTKIWDKLYATAGPSRWFRGRTRSP